VQVFQLALTFAVQPLAECMGTKDEATEPALYSLPCIKKWNDTQLQRIVRHFKSEVRPVTLSLLALLAVLVHKCKKKVEKTRISTSLLALWYKIIKKVERHTFEGDCASLQIRGTNSEVVYLLYWYKGTKNDHI